MYFVSNLKKLFFIATLCTFSVPLVCMDSDHSDSSGSNSPLSAGSGAHSPASMSGSPVSSNSASRSSSPGKLAEVSSKTLKEKYEEVTFLIDSSNLDSKKEIVEFLKDREGPHRVVMLAACMHRIKESQIDKKEKDSLASAVSSLAKLRTSDEIESDDKAYQMNNRRRSSSLKALEGAMSLKPFGTGTVQTLEKSGL